MVFINAKGLEVYAVKISLESKCYPQVWKLCTIVDTSNVESDWQRSGTIKEAYIRSFCHIFTDPSICRLLCFTKNISLERPVPIPRTEKVYYIAA